MDTDKRPQGEANQEHHDALNLPVDDALLEPLGRVTWAAIRLHHGIRDALNYMSGEPSDAPFRRTLGQAITDLRGEAMRLDPADRDRIVHWVDTIGTPVSERRDGVVHAIAYTDPDGRQALRGAKPGRPPRYDADVLLTIASELVKASRALPRAPYTLDPAAARRT